MRHVLVLLQRHGLALLNFVLVLGVCALAADWTWVFFAPKAVVVLPKTEAVQEKTGASLVSAHLFGSNSKSSAMTTLNLKLIGLFSPQANSPGFAIFQSAGKSIVVLPKGEVFPGVTLFSINKDHVLLLRNGAKEMLKLEEKAPPPDLSAKAPAK